MFCNLTKKQVCILFGLTFFALTVCAIGGGVYVHEKLYPRKLNQTTGGAVTNGLECSQITKQILDKGGSFVDAGISTSLCEGVAMAQSMGLGGGFFATIYKKSEGRVYTLDARETAPSAATKNMFAGRPEASKIGGLAVGVPGEIRGYQYLHQKFGVLSWRELFQPVIALCRSGVTVTPYLAKVYKQYRSLFLGTPEFSDFINPKTGEPFEAGEKVKRFRLAETLEIVASEPDALHGGSMTEDFVRDIAEMGGIITAADMNEYRPQWREPVVVHLGNNLTVHTFPPPSSGAVLGFMLMLLDQFHTNEMNSTVNWQRVLESFKFAYGMRTKFGDPNFVPEMEAVVQNLTSAEFVSGVRSRIRDNFTSQDAAYYGADEPPPDDHGTAHINILAPNGDAFVLTGTINLIFGAKIVSKSTGIILNNEMDDFSTKSSSGANRVEAGKRPLSSMCPSIVLDGDGNVRLLIGAAGGTKIITAAQLVAMRHLWYNETIDTAIAAARMHHQLIPMEVSFEPQFSDELVAGLTQIGHVMRKSTPDGFGAVTALTNVSGYIDAAFDPRRGGSLIIFND